MEKISTSGQRSGAFQHQFLENLTPPAKATLSPQISKNIAIPARSVNGASVFRNAQKKQLVETMRRGNEMRTAIFAAFMAIVSTAPAFAENAKPAIPTMAIKGEGEYYVKPDYATFTLTVETRELNSGKAMSVHAAKISKTAKQLEELKSDGLSVEKASFAQRVEQKMERNPNIQINGQSFTRPVGPPESVLTTVYSLKTRKIDSESLTKLVGTLASGDIYDLGNLAFATDNPRNALLMARKTAVQDAREQAETYAEAAGIKLIEIAEITDADASIYRYGAGEADLPARRALAPGQKYPVSQWMKVSQIVPPETLRFNASVNIMWRIGPSN